jgi:hypothetical protein
MLPAKSTTVVKPADADLLWLLGILNSRLMAFYYLTVFGGDRLQGGYLRIGPPQIRTLPIPDFVDGPTDYELRDQVSLLLGLHERRRSLATPHERGIVMREIESVEGRIDDIVYELYGLTEGERAVVDASKEPLAT